MFEIKKTEYANKTFRMEKSLVEALSKCASENHISVNTLVTQCCEYALNNMKIEHKDKAYSFFIQLYNTTNLFLY